MIQKLCRIAFTTNEGDDSTEFDTQNLCEILDLFHTLLEESNLKLKSVDCVTLLSYDTEEHRYFDVYHINEITGG